MTFLLWWSYRDSFSGCSKLATGNFTHLHLVPLNMTKKKAHLTMDPFLGGATGTRTLDLFHAMEAL